MKLGLLGFTPAILVCGGACYLVYLSWKENWERLGDDSAFGTLSLVSAVGLVFLAILLSLAGLFVGIASLFI